MSFSILVVDDEPDVADLFRQRFRREAAGHLCAAFRHLRRRGARQIGERGPARIDRHPVGYQCARDGWPRLAARDQRAPPRSAGMMVTAYGDDERRRHAAEAGALQFLTKPVDFELLRQELRRLSATPI